jgi:hypothetical protein
MRTFPQTLLPLQEPDIRRRSWDGQVCAMVPEGGRQLEAALEDLSVATLNPSPHHLSPRSDRSLLVRILDVGLHPLSWLNRKRGCPSNLTVPKAKEEYQVLPVTSARPLRPPFRRDKTVRGTEYHHPTSRSRDPTTLVVLVCRQAATTSCMVAVAAPIILSRQLPRTRSRPPTATIRFRRLPQ